MRELFKRAFVRTVFFITDLVDPGSSNWARCFYREQPLTGFAAKVASFFGAR